MIWRAIFMMIPTDAQDKQLLVVLLNYDGIMRAVSDRPVYFR